MKSTGVVVLSVLLFIIPVCLASQGAPDGAKLFKARCGSCHGTGGEGNPNAKIPAIKKTPMTADKLVGLITKGGVGSSVHASPIVNLNAPEAEAIAKHVKSLK